MNSLYPAFREKCLTGGFDWLTDDVRIALCEDGYVFDVAHTDYTDLVEVVATSANLTGKTAVGGVADADDVTFTGIGAGDNIRSVVIYQHTGVAATDTLIAFFDRNSAASPINVERTGFDLQVRWSNGSLKIFRL
jgi:hypothetical protein